MRPVRAVAVLAALAAGLAATCSPEEQAVGLAGCYQFERNEGARGLGLPWGVELVDEPLGSEWPGMSGRAGVRRARTATSPTERGDVPFGYWAPAGTDSLEIGYPGGGGMVLTLGVSGPDLIGGGRGVGDAIPLGGSLGPRPPLPVVARRVLCGAS